MTKHKNDKFYTDSDRKINQIKEKQEDSKQDVESVLVSKEEIKKDKIDYILECGEWWTE